MDLFETVLLILLVVVAVCLCGLILIQQSRGSDIGAAFGSGAANTLFGSSGATPFLVKVTAVLAIGFFAISFGLAFTAKERASLAGNYNFGDLPMSEEEVVEPTPEGDSTSSDGDTIPMESDSDADSDEGDALPPPTDTDQSPDAGDDLPDSPDI